MASRPVATCRKSLQQHLPNLERDIEGFKEMLEDLTRGEGKYILPLSWTAKKMHKRCKTIAEIIYDLECHQLEEEDDTVARELAIEVVRWEDKIKAFLMVIGKIEEEFKTAQDNFENAQRIKKEREFQAATRMQHTMREEEAVQGILQHLGEMTLLGKN